MGYYINGIKAVRP